MDNIQIFISENWISLVGAIIGLAYLYLEYRANVWMWLASLVMAAFYIYIFHSTQLYASMAIYVYFFFASIYGWIMWRKKNRNMQTGEEVIARMPQKYFSFIIIAIAVVFAVIFILLKSFSWNSYFVTTGDALTTSLNIVALWMISRKWADMWLLLIPANFLSSALLFVQQDLFSGILFLIFAVVSIGGFYNWRSLSRKA